MSKLDDIQGERLSRYDTLRDTIPDSAIGVFPTHNLPTAILDVFKRHGHNEIDTARVYG